MNIFTLIEYTSGGDKSPCSCCTECVSSDLSISSWDETDYDYWVKVIARKTFELETKNYEFDDFTLLINGFHVNNTDGSCINDHRGNTTSEEDTLHDAYVEKFLQDVTAIKDLVKKEYEEKEVDKRTKALLNEQEKQRLTILRQEEAERKEYEKLKTKFESNLGDKE